MTEATAPRVERPLRSLLALPTWRWWVLSCFLARLPVTMVAVAMVLAGQRLESFAVGARLAAAASVASGLGAWWRARVMDRTELRRSISRDLSFTALGYAVVAALVQARAPVLLVGVAVVAASAASSALFAGYRSMLATLVPARLLTSAFAVDAVLVEVAFVCGPALAGLLSLVIGPAGVLGVMGGAAACAVVATSALPRRPPVPLEEGVVRAPPPWADAQTVANYVGTAALGVTIGLFEAGFAPFAELLGHRAGLGGLFSAAYAFGSGVGGVVFATRLADRRGHAARAIVLMAVLGVLLLPVAAAPSLGVLVGLLLVAGSPFATANAAASSHLQSRLHPARSTEGFALGTMCIFLGVAAGNAVASVILDSSLSPRAIYVAAAVPPVIAAAGIGLWALTRRRGR